MAELCERSDELQRANKWREAYDILKDSEDTDDLEVLWRLIRSYRYVGKFLANTAERNDIVRKGKAAVEKGIGIDPNHFELRKWSGIFVSWSSDLLGTKERLKQSFVIKEHFLAALKANDSDSSVKHLMGRWCYGVASISWLNRKAAAAFFAEPPKSTYEEALQYFQDSEEASPGRSISNWLYLGKTLHQLGRKKEAKEYLQKVSDATPNNPEEEECQEEAKGLIKKV